MNQEQLKHIADCHYKKLKKYLKQSISDFDTEMIHQFRVEYKKLRALYRMLSFEKEATGKIKIAKKLKKCYNIVGSIRDMQLQQQRILSAISQGDKKPRNYLRFLQKEINKLKPKLFKLFSQDPISGSKKKTRKLFPDEFTLNDFRNFVLKEWGVIYEIILPAPLSDDNIHSIRKNLKDLFYDLSLFEEFEQDLLSLSVWKGKDKSYFTNLLDELGSFQDKCRGIILLKYYQSHNLNGSNQKLLNQVKRAWIQDKNREKQSLIKKMKADIYTLL